jgi:hypothetical protein
MRPFEMVPLDFAAPLNRPAPQAISRSSTATPAVPATAAATAAPERQVASIAGHDSMREGLTIGLSVATGIWAWIALVDAMVGQPFHTFTLLGGIIGFTVVHYLLNATYGIVIVSAVHESMRAPSAIFGLGFGFLIFEFAFAFLTVGLSNVGLGDLAWLRIFGGNLVGAAIAIIMLARRHPLLTLLHEAEHER